VLERERTPSTLLQAREVGLYRSELLGNKLPHGCRVRDRDAYAYSRCCLMPLRFQLSREALASLWSGDDKL
jgi:hypothetical protein